MQAGKTYCEMFWQLEVSANIIITNMLVEYIQNINKTNELFKRNGSILFKPVLRIRKKFIRGSTCYTLTRMEGGGGGRKSKCVRGHNCVKYR